MGAIVNEHVLHAAGNLRAEPHFLHFHRPGQDEVVPGLLEEPPIRGSATRDEQNNDYRQRGLPDHGCQLQNVTGA